MVSVPCMCVKISHLENIRVGSSIFRISARIKMEIRSVGAERETPSSATGVTTLSTGGVDLHLRKNEM